MGWTEVNRICNVTDYCENFLGVKCQGEKSALDKSFAIEGLTNISSGTNPRDKHNLFHYYCQQVEGDTRPALQANFSLERCKSFPGFFETIYSDLYATGGASQYWTHLSRAVKTFINSMETLEKQFKSLNSGWTKLKTDQKTIDKELEKNPSPAKKKLLNEKKAAIEASLTTVEEQRDKSHAEFIESGWQKLSIDQVFRRGLDELLKIAKKGKAGEIAVPMATEEAVMRSGEIDEDTTSLRINKPEFLRAVIAGLSAKKYSLRKLKVLKIEYIEKIPNFVFQKMQKLERLEAVFFKDIGGRAFENCTRLKSLYLDGERESIVRWNAFAGCSALERVTLKYGISSYGAHAFAGCRNAAFHLCENVQDLRIGESAFKECKSVTVPVNHRVAIGDRAFEGCLGVRLELAKGAELDAGLHAFDGCGVLKVCVPSARSSDIKIRPGSFGQLTPGNIKWFDAKGVLLPNYEYDAEWFSTADAFREDARRAALSKIGWDRVEGAQKSTAPGKLQLPNSSGTKSYSIPEDFPERAKEAAERRRNEKAKKSLPRVKFVGLDEYMENKREEQIAAQLEREEKEKTEEVRKRGHKSRDRKGTAETDGRAGSVAGNTGGKKHKNKHRHRTVAAGTTEKARTVTERLDGGAGELPSAR